MNLLNSSNTGNGNKFNDSFEDCSFSFHDVAGQLTSSDLESFARQYVSDVFCTVPEFKGMILRGGVGRGTADELSDVDFTIILDGDVRDTVTTRNLPLGMHRHGGIMYSARYESLQKFASDPWSIEMQHAYSHVRLVDCSPEVEAIIKSKTELGEDVRLYRIIDNMIQLHTFWKGDGAFGDFTAWSEPYKQVMRGEVLGAHLSIDRGAFCLKRLLFDLNKLHYPEEKHFFVPFFENLAIQPLDFDLKVHSLLAGARDESTIAGRIRAFSELAREITKLVKSKMKLPDDPYRSTLDLN